jgi:hypothetical protein
MPFVGKSQVLAILLERVINPMLSALCSMQKRLGTDELKWSNNGTTKLNIHDYLAIFYAESGTLFPLCLYFSFYFTSLPKVYQATTMILSTTGVPENYVRSTITDL